MNKIQMNKTAPQWTYLLSFLVFVLNFENLGFEFVSNFGFRASDFTIIKENP